MFERLCWLFNEANDHHIFLCTCLNVNKSHGCFFCNYVIIVHQKTARDPSEALFDTNNGEGSSLLYLLSLIVLEQLDYCSFENYLESLHNAIHFMIGGAGSYSLTKAKYAGYDPMFMILHSAFDRFWIVWQVGAAAVIFLERRHLWCFAASADVVCFTPISYGQILLIISLKHDLC